MIEDYEDTRVSMYLEFDKLAKFKKTLAVGPGMYFIPNYLLPDATGFKRVDLMMLEPFTNVTCQVRP